MKTIGFEDRTTNLAGAGAPGAAEPRVAIALLGARRNVLRWDLSKKLLKIALLTCVALPIEIGIFSVSVMLGSSHQGGTARPSQDRLTGIQDRSCDHQSTDARMGIATQ